MKNHYRKINRKQYSLGDLVEIVASCAQDSRETVAALVDLFETGRVRLANGGHFKRVKIAAAR